MKRVKRIKIVALVVVILVFCVTITAPTLSKYVGNTDVTYNSKTDLDYTVNSVFVVTGQEELFAAINQGYTYVQLSKEIENPLIITQQSANLEADLILDLNGIEIQRNGPEPILNIGPGVKLTVTDSSAEQTGGLYNPVGSVFNITGGTLSVVTGNFESGPRYSEYLSYNHDILENTPSTERTVVENEPQLVNLVINEKVGDTVVHHTYNNSYMPIIRSYPVNTGEIIYTHGNLYCDKSVFLASDKSISFGVDKPLSLGTGEFYIPKDTYLYYRSDKVSSAASDLNNPSDASWYYTYYVHDGTYEYESAALPDDYAINDYLKITVYAYENTVESAAEIDVPSQYYAAIQMQGGTLEVQTGGFYSYFGLSTTACVNASGGVISVGEGVFSSRVPDALNTNTLTDKGNDMSAFGASYFESFIWTDPSFGSGSQAGQGEGYCILNHGEATVDISSGLFHSSNNNILSMQNGVLHINEGSFYKKQTVEATSSDKILASAVYMNNGSLSLKNAKFFIEGNYTNGIYSTVNTDIPGNSFTVTDTSFTMTNGNNQIGICTEQGMVQLNSTSGSNSKITLNGTDSVGILAENGGSVAAKSYDILLRDKNSIGIMSTSGSVDMTGGSITLDSNNFCYGIYANSNEIISIKLTGTKVNVGYNDPTSKTGTVAASIGVFMASSNNASQIILDGADIKSYEIGISLKGGSLIMENGGVIRTVKASAIDLEGGTLTLNDNAGKNAVYTVVSSNTNNTSFLNNYNIKVPALGSSMDIATFSDYDNLHGIYVSGGDLVCKGKLNFIHTGLQNSPYTGGVLKAEDQTGEYYYNGLKVRSYAVCVDGGSVVIEKCNIEARSGGGVYCSGGNITMGVGGRTEPIGTLNNEIIVNTTGNLVGDIFYPQEDGKYDNWRSRKSLTGGHAVELNGGNIVVYYGSFTATFGNGLQATGNDTGSGTIKVYGGNFIGNSNGSTPSGIGGGGIAINYGLKVIGATTVDIYGGYFDGKNGGVVISGIDRYAGESDFGCTAYDNKAHAVLTKAVVRIYGGEFGNPNPWDGINVYDNAYVVFGAYTKEEIKAKFNKTEDDFTLSDDEKAELVGSMILYGKSATVALNSLGESDFKKEVYIFYGDFEYASPSHGIYSPGVSKLEADADPYDEITEYDFILEIYNIEDDLSIVSELGDGESYFADDIYGVERDGIVFYDPAQFPINAY